MIDISKFFNIEWSGTVPAGEEVVTLKRCYDHSHDLPCPHCAEDMARGYTIRTLAGRCANGSELDSGTRWHALPIDSWKALCGAEPGRRSAGWSSWFVVGQGVTCPRCLKKLERKNHAN